MSTANPLEDFESAPVNPSGLPTAEKKEHDHHMISVADANTAEEEGRRPTEEELATLPLVAAALPWPAVAMCLIEFSERASYYGTSGVFGNFVRLPLPEGGSGTGAVAPGAPGVNQSAGALGLGLQISTALTQLFTFLAYTIPILGGIIADTKWGRFKTICIGTAIGAIAHVILVIPAIPSVIAGGHAVIPFVFGLLSLAFAAGFIKPSLGPLLCDQSPITHQTVVTNKKGKKVILDPAVTVSSYLTIFYFCINVGAFFAVATTYAEREVGFWLAYLLPGILYMMMPIVLVLVAKRLYKAPPQGSVVKEFVQVLRTALGNGGWKRVFKGGDTFWDRAKPSQILATQGSVDESRIVWDDKFVDEIKQSLSACAIFLFIPIFNLADGGMGNVEGAMSSAMTVNGVPNDLISNFNSLTIVIFAPILNYLFYPAWQRMTGKPMKPMTRMSIGFMLGCINMIYGAVLQWRVYETSPCGYSATSKGCTDVSPLSLWLQIPLYSVPAIGELFINVTSYEIAYTRAPARMKGLVYSAVLFTSALSSAITLIVNATPALQDPYLIWSYCALAICCFIIAIILPWKFSSMDQPIDFADRDRMEGKKNSLPSDVVEEERSLQGDDKKAMH